MNKRVIFFTVLAVGILLMGWWFLRGTARHTTPNVAPAPSASSVTTQPVVLNATTIPVSAVVTSKLTLDKTHFGLQSVRLFKATNYPPRTADEKALWDWWDAMDKLDPDFQWKMPIEFYGKVVDQFDQPVAGAEVELNWTTVVGPIPDPKRIIFTDANGRFEVTGIQGKSLWIAVDINVWHIVLHVGG